MRSTSSLCLVSVLLMAGVQRAAGQSYNYHNMVIDHSMMTSQLSQSIFNDMMLGKMTRESLRGSTRARTDTSGSGTAGTGSTTFRPVGGYLAPGRLARQFAKTPKQRAELERMFSELLDTYKKALREKGVSENDVARAASFAVATSYDVLAGEGDLPILTPEQMDGLRKQMRDLFSSSPRFQSLPDRQRQELYEGYAIVGMYLGALANGTQKNCNPKAISEMRKMASGYLRSTFGVPHERLRLTNDGIEF